MRLIKNKQIRQPLPC